MVVNLYKLGGSIRISFIILIFNIALSYELTTFSEMTFPLGINSDASIIVGTNLNSQAVIWNASDGATIVGDGEFWGVSEDGKIAGSLYNSAGKEEAVIYENGIITYLGNVPGGNSCDAFYSSGLGMSSDGTTVVGMGWENCSVEAFYWNSIDNIVGLGQLNGNSTKAQAVNSNGSIIGGWAQNNSGTRQSCIWDMEGNSTLIGSLSPWSDAGEVMAFTEDGSRIVGFGASTGGNDTEAYMAIENSNVLGGYEFIGLGVPSNFATFNESMAFDISENNVVVGQYINSWGPDGFRASIWTEELGTMIDFHDYLESLGIDNLSSWTFLKAHCISNDGTIIAGVAQNSFGNWVTFIIDLEDELGNNLLGDINADDSVDVLDVVMLVSYILSGDTSELDGADINNDGEVNILDVVQLVNIILGVTENTVTDIDGNVYETVQIGGQLWMAENLKVAHYQNSEDIPYIYNDPQYGAYINYSNNADNVGVYGRLYNWFAVNDERGLCPDNWHVPSDDEFKSLEMYLGMSESEANGEGLRGTDEGGKLKEEGNEHWNSPNTGATNETDFIALPGGSRRYETYTNQEIFSGLNRYGFFWSSSEVYTVNAWYRVFSFDYSESNRYHLSKTNAFSIRCVED